VPLAMAFVTVLVVRWWMKAPGGRVAALICLLLVDLFMITRFVDVPARASVHSGLASPAAAWLRDEAAATRPFRICSLARSYCDRPGELLLPKAGQAMGFATITSYGTWQSPAHAHLFAFDRYGHNTDWAWLIRRNHLLSLYGVRYILAAEPEFREVIESVKVAESGRAGPEVPVGRWELHNAEERSGSLRLMTPFMWRPSRAWTQVALGGGRVYTARFEARGPDGGAANYLSVWLYRDLGGGRYFGGQELSSLIGDHRIGPDWRRFEWTFRTPAETPQDVHFGLTTLSERPIEVRGVKLRESGITLPINIGRKLEAGRNVYEKVAEFPPLNAGDRPVVIYENLLWQPGVALQREATGADIERLKWPDDEMTEALLSGRLPPVPDASIAAKVRPGMWLWSVMVPTAAVYSCGVAAAYVLSRRRRGPAAR